MYLKRRPAEKWGPPLSTLVCLEWLLIGHAYLNDLVSVWKSELSRTHCCFQSGDRYTWKCLKVGSYSFPCICNSFPPATSPAYMTSVTTKFPPLSKVYPQRQSGVMRVELALYCQHASTCSVEHRVHAHTHTQTHSGDQSARAVTGVSGEMCDILTELKCSLTHKHCRASQSVLVPWSDQESVCVHGEHVCVRWLLCAFGISLN